MKKTEWGKNIANKQPNLALLCLGIQGHLTQQL